MPIAGITLPSRTCLYTAYVLARFAGGLIAFSSHSRNHSAVVTLERSTNSLRFAARSSSVSCVCAAFFVPRNVTHFCLRFRRPVVGSVW
jgi:hypothetical protein